MAHLYQKLVWWVTAAMATVLAWPALAFAQTDIEYTLLERSFPGVTTATDTCGYLPTLFTMIIGVIVLLSVLVIVLGAIQYILGSVNLAQKQDAKERMLGAGIGLIMAIGSWLLLASINDDILSCSPLAPVVNTTADATPAVTPDIAPVITLTPELVRPTVGDVIDFLDGVSVSDSEDPLVVADIEILGNTFDTSVPGTYTVTYRVTDSGGNETAVQRVYIVEADDPTVTLAPVPAPAGPPAPPIDTIPPQITLHGSDPITIDVGSAYAEPGFYAWDSKDGDVTASVTSDAAAIIDTSTNGSFTVTYSVTDSDGNTATVTRVVDVVYNIDASTDVSYRRSCFGLLPLGPCAAADFDGDGFINAADEFAAYGYISTLPQNEDYVVDMANGSPITSCVFKINSSAAAFPNQNCSKTTGTWWFSSSAKPTPCVTAYQNYPVSCALPSYAAYSLSSGEKNYYENVMDYADPSDVGRYNLKRVYGELLCNISEYEDWESGITTWTWNCNNTAISIKDRIFYSTLQQYDLNNDGIVDTSAGSADLAVFEACRNNPLLSGCLTGNNRSDINRDGVINYGDLSLNNYLVWEEYLAGTTIGELERTTFLPEQYTDRRIVAHCATYGYKVRSCSKADVNGDGVVNAGDTTYFDTRSTDATINLNGDTVLDGYSMQDPPPPATASYANVTGVGAVGQSCAAWQGAPVIELQLVMLQPTGSVFSVTNNCIYENTSTGVFTPRAPGYTDPNSRPVGRYDDPFTGMIYQTQKKI